MTETQQYRVVADRDKGDDPDIDRDYREGDRLVFENWDTGYYDERQVGTLVRIERPVPTTDEAEQSIEADVATIREAIASIEAWPTHSTGVANLTNEEAAALERVFSAALSPHPPTREQTAETLYLRRFKHPAWDRLGGEQERWLKDADAVLALIQNGADR